MKQAVGAARLNVMEGSMTPDPVRAFLPPILKGRDLIINPIAGIAIPAETPKHRTAGQHLWSTFWQEFCPENEPQERCHVPGDGRQVVDQHWAQFAEGLPAHARVIDLGCGAGTVGCTLLKRRADLCVTGVDWAKVPAIQMANLIIHQEVNMEALPFGDGGFDSAVSLFGIEYADSSNTTRELERTLKAGARFSFLVHHCESEIAREGNARRRALKELISGRMKAVFLAGNLAGIEQQRQILRKQYPDEPMVNLVSNHFARNIVHNRVERQSIWQKLADELETEIALLLHLERAAKSANDMAVWLAPLLSAMYFVSVSVLRRRSGEPIAWTVNGIR
jgi:SAM-dependent methyltransferase